MATLTARRLAPLAVVALIVLLIGCRGQPWPSPPADQLDRTWLNQPATTDTYPDPDATLVAALSGQRPVTAGPPLNVLLLSGGGKFGAYTAGLLVGWTETGTRPTFDVVTGISSGALTAVDAFLGPKYDGRMAWAYTTATRTDLFRFQPIRGMLTRTGLATSEPLARLIEREFDDEAMADLRAAHGQGRRLFVATGNLITFRPAYWDVGAIACCGRPDANQLVRKILLAACSIPGMLPPVEIDVVVNGHRYRELHGDAGNITQAFLRTANGLPPGSNVYVMTAGKVYRDPLPERPGPVRMLGSTVSNSLYALFRDDMIKLYSLCVVSGARFNLVAIPQDFEVTPGSMSFATEELRRMYALGHGMASGGIPWQRTPPGAQPGETPLPRTGLGFVVP